MVEISTKEDFPSIKQLEALYKVAPRSNNQVDFPIFIFESTDYYVVYYNNPACAASILDKNTGEIVFFINRVLEYTQSKRTGDGSVIES